MCKAIDDMRKEARDEGWDEGHNEGILEILASLVSDGILTLTQAAARAGISAEEFLAKTSE